MAVCKQIELGRSASIPETMVKWEGSPIPVPYVYFRTSSMVAHANFCGPEDLMNNAWNDVVNCAMGAAGAAVVASIVGSPAAALPAFEAGFKACLTAKIGARIGEIQVQLSANQQPNEDWHR